MPHREKHAKINKLNFPLDANRFNKKLKDTVAVEREKLVLDVELQDQTAPAIFFFNGNRIEPNERVEIKNLGGGKHQLIFNRVEMSDDGEISCESGQLKSSCKLTVKKGESKPIVEIPDKVEGPCNTPLVFVVPYKSKFSIFFGSRNDNIHLIPLKIFVSCSFIFNSSKITSYRFVAVEGTKQSQVEAKLLKDGKALPLKDVEIVVGEDKITFKIKKPSRDQSGVYQVKISNNQGEEVNDVNINMQGKKRFTSSRRSSHRLASSFKISPSDVPSPPRDVDVNEIFQDSCVVSFKPSKDDGGTPITKYVIERLDLSLKAQWDNVGEVMPGEKCSYKVQDLVAKKEYKFRIRAVNKLGSSEPAMFGKPVLAKDPWGNVLISFYNCFKNLPKKKRENRRFILPLLLLLLQ